MPIWFSRFLTAGALICCLGACGGGGGKEAAPVVPDPPIDPPPPPGIPEPEADLRIKSANYLRVLAKTYLLLTKGTYTGFWTESPDPDSQVCTSGTQGHRLIDNDGNGRTSAGDRVEKTYADCRYSGANGSALLDGNIIYDVVEVSSGGKVIAWKEARLNTSRLTLEDSLSNDCTAGFQCEVGVEGQIKRIQDADGLRIEVDDFAAVGRLVWLDTGALEYRTIGISMYSLSPVLGGQSFRLMAKGRVDGDTMYGLSNVQPDPYSAYHIYPETVTALTGATHLNGGYAGAGELLILGEDRTATRLLPQGNTGLVRVELDENGDGSFEVNQTLTWAALMEN